MTMTMTLSDEVLALHFWLEKKKKKADEYFQVFIYLESFFGSFGTNFALIFGELHKSLKIATVLGKRGNGC